MAMENRFSPPQAPVSDVAAAGNNSGEGSGSPVPDAVRGWCWGGFTLGWIWAIGNSTWIGLLCLIPYVGFVVAILLGVRGREMAWRNKRWQSIEHFKRVQRLWSMWGAIVWIAVVVLGVLGGIMAPAYRGYTQRHPVHVTIPAAP